MYKKEPSALGKSIIAVVLFGFFGLVLLDTHRNHEILLWFVDWASGWMSAWNIGGVFVGTLIGTLSSIVFYVDESAKNSRDRVEYIGDVFFIIFAGCWIGGFLAGFFQSIWAFVVLYIATVVIQCVVADAREKR